MGSAHRYVIRDVPFITVESFALRTYRKEATIRKLIREGNAIRKIQAIKQGNYWLIPESEIYDYPFVEPGKVGNKLTSVVRYHKYNKDGSISMLTIPIHITRTPTADNQPL